MLDCVRREDIPDSDRIFFHQYMVGFSINVLTMLAIVLAGRPCGG